MSERLHSFYCVTCLCGRQLRTETLQPVSCPDCKRVITLEWPGDYEVMDPPVMPLDLGDSLRPSTKV